MGSPFQFCMQIWHCPVARMCRQQEEEEATSPGLRASCPLLLATSHQQNQLWTLRKMLLMPVSYGSKLGHSLGGRFHSSGTPTSQQARSELQQEESGVSSVITTILLPLVATLVAVSSHSMMDDMKGESKTLTGG